MKQLLLFLLLLVSAASHLQSEALAAGPQQSRIIIDGSVNPEMISDYYAYSLFFRMLSNGGAQRPAVKGILGQIGMRRASLAEDGSQIERLVDAADDFVNRVHPLNLQITELLQKVASDAASTAILRALRQGKEKICTEIILSLSARLGKTDAEKVHSHVQNMKRNMKMLSE